MRTEQTLFPAETKPSYQCTAEEELPRYFFMDNCSGEGIFHIKLPQRDKDIVGIKW